MNLKLMVTKIFSPILSKFKIKFNLEPFCISILVNPSSKLSKENLQKAINNVLMESIKRCHRSVTVKEIGKAPKGNSKPCQTSDMELFSASCYWI